jgi:hypothetical protein
MADDKDKVDQDPLSKSDSSNRTRSVSHDSSKTIIHRPEAATRLPFLTPEEDTSLDSEIQSSPAETTRPPYTPLSQIQQNWKSNSVALSPRKRLPRKPVPRSTSGWENTEQRTTDTTGGASNLAEAYGGAKQNPISTTGPSLASTTWMPQRSTSMPLTARNLWDVATEGSLSRETTGAASKKSGSAGKKSVRDRIIDKLPKFLRPRKRT